MELLVQVFDRYEGVDKLTRSKSTGRGDVIAVQPDGWQWGKIEKSSCAWIILKVPMARAKAESMLSKEPGDVRVKPLLQLRAFKLDLDVLASRGYKMPDAVEARALRYPKGADSHENTRAIESILITEADFDAAKVRKPALLDESVIG